MKTTTNFIYPAFAVFGFACFMLSPRAQAVCQEGCLTNFNTVLGEDALLSNTGGNNTAIGFQALFANTLGYQNTATGDEALASNTSGVGNTATGMEALAFNMIGSDNTANGRFALLNNTGSFNTATGSDALNDNTTGEGNTANGYAALSANMTGSFNTAVGWSAGEALNGSNNIAVGFQAGFRLTTGNNNIDIGNTGVEGESKTIRIGAKQTHRAAFIAGISGVTVPAGVGVIIGTNGQLGTVVSSKRFKAETKPMDNVSEAILALKPVTFHYKKELDPDGIPQFGLVAEEVEKVNPDLVARDEQGKPYTVRYDAVNAMLLNEFLKEHRKVEQLTKDFESRFAEQQTQIQQLTAGLQKVSAQVELEKAPAQTVVNNH